MPNLEKPISFDEFRRAHSETLDAQREHLRDDGIASRILREAGNKFLEWVPWDNASVNATH